ncbi:Hsp70 family protein [Methylovulum psychrotolerans]|uniref:Molecular chaperone DnaK n=1 Tax=Methylovulum psychrotolerans TaxID=1704499 RepID=A0A2S5CFU0_9GAMM|nr:Hsp70 family protein [Methylovulum psychrotolerans]POZ49673.1 molecular chaperone DnaK [Methylovulum psychrotolerans]
MAMIGIDLGTTNTLCSYWLDSDDVPKLIPISQSTLLSRDSPIEAKALLPSVVYTPKSGVAFVGEKFKTMSWGATQNQRDHYFSSMKKYMGTSYVREVNGELWSPERVAACLLKYVREQAEFHLREPITRTIITIPASFNTEQRSATLRAAQIASMPGVILIDEPTAALCYQMLMAPYFDYKHPNVLMMLDIGGGTFDVSIIKVQQLDNGRELSILGQSRYNEMAGDDFDLYIAGYLLARLEQQNSVSFSSLKQQDQLVLAAYLLYSSEEAKRALSDQVQRLNNDILARDFDKTFVALPPINMPEVLQQTKEDLGKFSVSDLIVALHGILPRNSTNENNPLAKPILEALDSAREVLGEEFGFHDLSNIFLTGGSAYLPILPRQFARVVGRPLKVVSKPMEAVALGASVFGRWHSRSTTEPVVLRQRLFESIYLQTKTGFVELLSKNQIIPVENHRCVLQGLNTGKQGRRRMAIRLFLGRSPTDALMKPMDTRYIEFDDLLPGNTPIEIDISVSINRTFELKFIAGGKTASLSVDHGRPNTITDKLPQVLT